MNPAPHYGRPNKNIPEKEKPPSDAGVISTKTKVRMDFLIAMVPVVVALTSLIFKVNAMTDALKNAWTVADMAVWSSQLQSDNPSMKIPRAIDIKQINDPFFAHAKKDSPMAKIP
jgi:hypothetical protein